VLLQAVLFLGGIPLVRSSYVVYQSIGSSLMAAGAAGWVMLVYVALTQRISNRLALLEDSGILRVFPARSVAIRPEYQERALKAKDGIDVIGFGLKALREDFRVDGFRQWASRAPIGLIR